MRSKTFRPFVAWNALLLKKAKVTKAFSHKPFFFYILLCGKNPVFFAVYGNFFAYFFRGDPMKPLEFVGGCVFLFRQCGVLSLCIAALLCGTFGENAWAKNAQSVSSPVVAVARASNSTEPEAKVSDAVRAEAQRNFAGTLTYAQMENVTEAAAVLALFDRVMRELAHHPDVRFAGENDGSASFTPPNLEGLARFLYGTRRVDSQFGRTGTTEHITVTVEAVQQHDNLRTAIVQGLRQPGLLERYASAASLQQAQLRVFDEFSTPTAGATSFQVDAELSRAANSLLATSGYLALLPEFGGFWQFPKKNMEKMKALAEISPGNPLVLSARAELFMQMDKAREAAEAVDAALMALPGQPFLHDIKGITALRQHMPALAAASFGTAIDHAPKNAAYLLHRASAYLVQGNAPAMCADFRAACAAGDCSGYQWARERGQCLPEEQGMEGPPALPASASEESRATLDAPVNAGSEPPEFFSGGLLPATNSTETGK